ncbi:MAG: phosphotransferase [Dehalococcoidia bacterium]
MSDGGVTREEQLRDVLAAFGVQAASVRDVRTGRVNRHWRIAATDGPEYALRRYASPPHAWRIRSREAIAFEHDALRHAASKGWPAPVPIDARSGSTLVERDGDLYALFPWHEGRPAPAHSKRYLRIKGRLLARLHRDMATFGLGEQRLGFARMWELDYYMGSPRPFNDMLREFEKAHRADASAVRAQRYRNLRELSRFGYGELPEQFGHFDFHRDNLLFSQGQLTGLIDFDSAHLDARVADIATSVALDCIEPPAYNAIDPDAMRAFVAGYVEGSPLSEQELALIVPLVRSWIVAAAAGRIAQWLAAPDEKVLMKIRRTVDYRIPAFEQRRQAMEQAVRSAAAERTRA